MKILLIHTNGISIDVDMSYKTLDDARAALKKAYDETKPCTFDAECENMSYCGEKYVIASDNSVYYTKDFDDDNLENAKLEFIFKLDEELDFEKHRNDTGCDAPDITMYKAEDGMLKVLYCVGNYNNVPSYTQIMRQKRRESYK